MRMPVAELHVLATPREATMAMAEFITTEAKERATAQGRFTIALSGGSTPRPLYELLASPAYAERITWDRWHVFWSDERCVPSNHVDSNYRMAKESLLGHVPIPAHQIHRMRGEAQPRQAAEEYEAELRLLLQESPPAIDLILLGMGEDGHTASLFGNTDALQETERLVVANWVPHIQAYRITFTLPLINAARSVAFLVTDESKASILHQVLRPAATAGSGPPASLVHPTSGTLHWFLTQAAASHL
jgi:6-phosphogluconolactonase